MAEYIEREAVLKIIDDNCPHDKGGYNTEEEMGAGVACYYIRKAVNDIPTADVAPRAEWISVEERLPDNNMERVLVFLMDDDFTKPIGDNKIDTDRFVDGKWVRWSRFVTHWMPLPEPPKGE